MPEQIIRILTPVKARWDALTLRQRIQLVSVTVIVLLALILFLYFTFRTTWVTAYANRDANEIMRIAGALDNAGIRNNPHSDLRGIDVPARNLTAAFAAVHQDPGAPSGMTIEDALDLAGLGTTEAQNAALLLEVHQSRIESTLMHMDGISDADVTITPADRNLMLRPNQPPASAGVRLTTTRAFSSQDGRNLAELIRTMVRGLELENIVITDQHLNAIFIGGQIPENDSAMDVFNMRIRQEAQMVANLTNGWRHMFDEVTVAPHIRYENFVGQEERTLIFTAPRGTEDGLPTFLQESREQAEGYYGNPFSPGLGANRNATPAYMIGDWGPASASARDRTVSFVHDQHEIVTTVGPGGMDADNSRIAVIATLDVFIYEEDWIERNPEGTRNDWLDHISDVPPFYMITDSPEIETMRLITAAATGIPLSNVEVVIQGRHIIIEMDETPLPISTIVMLALLLLLIAMLLIALLARKKEEEEEVEPELSVEDLLATTQLEEAKEEAERLKEIDYETENEIKKQIDKFVNEKPEAVAALLRNWLNAEEW
jgi:flagellar M-ring protein FliF